ncbi:MAG: hypothetical protein R3352_09965 [Salinisphaeraceae bacterium]|nr:hypothetical protein [Salinisphaeraceae bacterium]
MAALIVVLAVLIWLGNLRLMISFLVTAAIVVAALVVFDWVQDNRSASLIAVEEIELIGFEMDQRPGGVYGLRGRVHNHSKEYRLLRLALRVLALDCANAEQPNAQCTAIGEQEAEFAVDIPVDQARDVQQRIRFGSQPLQPRGTLRWQYEVVGTVGG